ncbi:MAG: D-aminoacylase [Bacillota bacterium]
MHDLVLANVFVVDGTGRPGFAGSVGVLRGRVARVAKGGEKLEGREVLELDGLTVCPGFVDVHSHSDISILGNPRAESSLRQGITTELAGNCGWSMAPLHKQLADVLATRLVSGLAGKEAAGAMVFNWSTISEFLDVVAAKGIGNNLGTFVGQSMVRGYVMGAEDRVPSSIELERMKALVDAAMRDGAFGLSSGRSYFPGRLASTEEVVELARVTARYQGLYTCHLKNQDTAIDESVEEVLDIGRWAKTPVQLAHHKVCSKPCWGRLGSTLGRMDEARSKGVDVMADVYPFTFTQIGYLGARLPEWVTREGESKGAELLQSPDHRRKAKEEMLSRVDPASGQPVGATVERMARSGVVYCRKTKAYEGMDLGEVASEKSTDLVDAMLLLLAENDLMVKTAGIMSDEDLRVILRHPLAMISTDAFALDRPLDEKASIHPRHYGTYPVVLGRYVREEGLLTLEEAVRKMTSLPARRVGLLDRGVILAGAWADLVVFDPATIGSCSTIENPAQFPAGIHYVLVNGKTTIAQGEYQDVRAGQVLRKGHP